MKCVVSSGRVRNARRGFSLLELLIVLAILGILAAIIVPNLLGTQQTAMIKATKLKISGLEQAVKTYAVNNQALYPEGREEEVFALLTAKTDAQGKPIKPTLEEIPLDAWEQQLHYEYPNTKTDDDKPAIWSSGPNKQDEQGGGDDVTNWAESK